MTVGSFRKSHGLPGLHKLTAPRHHVTHDVGDIVASGGIDGGYKAMGAGSQKAGPGQDAVSNVFHSGAGREEGRQQV